MTQDLPTGTVTFLFTDIEGSTRLLHELGVEEYAKALGEHRRVLREAFDRHGGTEIDTQGDSFFVAFPTAPGALKAAREAQEALSRGRIRVRMGIHTGTPFVDEGQYVGVDVHRAARIAACGHGGQVLISASTAALTGTEGLRDLGEHRLKDLSAPERIYQLGDHEFSRLKTLYQTNLPIPATPFLGRQSELPEVVELLQREEVRLVTLTGPGGTGKTRLGLQSAGAAADSYPDGVWWVPLAPVRDAQLVAPSIARALGGTVDVAEHIADKRMLIFLDNFEHIIDAAPQVGELIAQCPRLDVLVTSRAPLRVAGEWDYAVEPLREAEAMELFTQRARAVRRDFEGNGAVAEICRRLDHLPLAVELAAARVNLLSPADLLQRLDRRLPLLKGGTRDAPERQRTLRATIEWSHDLLTPEEQQLFSRLAVFVGGFTVESAEAVCEADLDSLERLIEHSLVRRWQSGRLGMLETIREFAAELQEASGEAGEIRRRHAEHFLEIAESANLSIHSLGRGPQRHELVIPEQHNIRAAIDWAAERDPELGLRLAVALENFWITNDPSEGARRFAALLSRADDIDISLKAKALRDYGATVDVAGDYDKAADLYGQSQQLFEQAGDESGVATGIFRLGIIAHVKEDLEEAGRLYEESLEIFRRIGDPIGELQVLGSLGDLEFERGNRRRGRELTEASRVQGLEIGWVWWDVSKSAILAKEDLTEGNIVEGEARAREMLRRAHEIRDRKSTVNGLGLLAWAAAERGDTERAGALWAVAEAEAARAPIARWDVWRPILAPHMPESTPDSAPLSLEEAVQFALFGDA
ncbi:MAG TPA: adenylate/guanylate cyclase domain-containing protein [Actinomycetota bacterium]|nr:adenylate/guanylate cyclase domain-containing protein [Actinomycetota bacterium]